MKTETKNESAHVYSAKKSGRLDNRLRNWLQNPYKILNPFLERGMTVLDLGCGNGYFTLPISEMTGPSGEVIAVDVQPEMLELLQAKILREQRSNITICQNLPDELSIDKRVDFILAAYVFHELPSQHYYLERLHSFLKGGEYMLIIEPRFVVSEAKFRKTVQLCADVDFELIEHVKVRFSRAILVKKGYQKEKYDI